MPSSTWVCPPGVFFVFVEAWGCGSNGTLNGLGTGGGGGGGAYGRTISIPVVPGHSYTVSWGTGGTGVSSDFSDDVHGNSLSVVAALFSSSTGGDGITNNVGATGGSHNGGNGTPAVGNPPTPNPPGPSGGGGGSVAGRTGNGVNAVGSVGALGPDGGGNGGDGGLTAPGVFAPPGPGAPGTVPGGGGGGPGDNFFGGGTSGAGADGGLYFWNATGGGTFAATILNPANIVGSFGGVLPAPPPLAINVDTDVGAITLSGFAPSVSVSVSADPGVGLVTLTGEAPTVVLVVNPKFAKRAFVM